MTLLTHLNKRLKSRPKIRLPVDSLFAQYQVSLILIFIYVVVQFYPWFNFNFPLFLGMVMYGNDTKDKIEPQHFHQNDVGKLGRGWRRKVSSIYSNSCPTHLFLLFFNWFLADLVKVIGVAVHTSKLWKVKKSDYWQLGKSKPWQKKPTDISG